ncbi:FAD-binding oxidoreductase [Arthrobacter sp. zg-Y1219]|uniref:FAD-binding oxidoreductase n=1 Tax=Arthrobacter sp. zg-Y1219 TaxID=3049067 RepID=UPI0024C393FF|nr:FAD-binding oxidoreductase [Arthrobacter sp. zg-Y1219]MDK1360718.1 FAD-binding oxidoreductase [Arthrobacter sp. zg-Y1219]
MFPELPPDAVEDLRTAVAGTVILPDEETYETARNVWNGMIDVRPALIVRAGSAKDIAPVLDFAQLWGLPLAVRGGGHNVAGNGTVADGVVLDMGALNDVSVDAGAGTVTVQAGATIGNVDLATAPYGLAVPLGVVSGTGVAGLTLGGGVGWLTRTGGLSIDNLLGADVVTSDGEEVRADADQHPELFWGLRGGGGNFGVVTSFTFSAHPLPAQVLTGNLVYGNMHWHSALHAYDAWTAGLPDEMTTIISCLVPIEEWDMGDQPLLVIGLAWADPDQEAGAALIRQLTAAAPPDMEVVEAVPWSEWQTAMDSTFPPGSRAYWKNANIDRLDDAAIDALVRAGCEQTWRGTGFDIHHLGGAYGRVSEDATAFPTRDAPYWLNIYGFWQDPADDAARTAFVRGVAKAVEPFSSGAQYVNFMGAEDPVAQGTAPSVYGTDKLARLTALKNAYDPQNLFRRNHNIVPST